MSSPLQFSLPSQPAVPERDFLQLGLYPRAGRSLGVNNRYLELDGQPWLPVMGEFHYSRYPAEEWETELRKMQAGGIAVVASYVFWNHHEASPGRFDWRGRRDLARFVRLAAEVGLYVYLRPGPWVHAESRNGGFPDWLLAEAPLRCNAPAYLARVASFFTQIGQQLTGLMWADGGPVIGLQLENEYDGVGPGKGAEHIAELKRLAIGAGLTVPLYTVTGWPTLDIPPREVVPVSGAYPDGFWSGETGPLPASGVFLFNTERSIGEMGNVGGTAAEGRIDPQHYPFFLAEAGGGMHVSYHRRPVVTADDLAATALVQLGSGANLYGYYMYHGGANPTDQAGRVHETQASGYPNDVPLINYDFRTPLGQYGQQRPSFGRLRCLHSFMAAFGAGLAGMDASLHRDAPRRADDRTQLRAALRGHGEQGFLFVNNHLRHHPLPAFPAQRFAIRHAGGEQLLPSRPVDIGSGDYFIWPIGLRLGGAVLRHATAQPLTRWQDGASHTLVLFQQAGQALELCFEAASVARLAPAAQAWLRPATDGQLLLCPPSEALPCRIEFDDAAGQTHTVLLLPQALAEQALPLSVAGRMRLLCCQHAAYLRAGQLELCAPAEQALEVRVWPGQDLADGEDAGEGWRLYRQAASQAPLAPVTVRELGRQGAALPLRLGPHIAWRGKAVPLAPDDGEFDVASRFALELPAGLPYDGSRLLLTLDYVGDAARLYADGQLVDDHFYDGEPWQIGIDRFASGGRWPALTLRILAADPAAPLFLEDAARAALLATGGQPTVRSATLQSWQLRQLPLSQRPD